MANWHTLASIRAEWSDAPKDDAVLQNLLDTAQHECVTYANDSRYLPSLLSSQGEWQLNANPGNVPGAGQVTSDTGMIADAVWLRFSNPDLDTTDQSAYLLVAKSLTFVSEDDPEQWVQHVVTSVVPAGAYTYMEVTFHAGRGVAGSHAWGTLLVGISDALPAPMAIPPGWREAHKMQTRAIWQRQQANVEEDGAALLVGIGGPRVYPMDSNIRQRLRPQSPAPSRKIG